MFMRFKSGMYPSKNGINEYLCTEEADIQKLPKYNVEGTQQLNDGKDEFNNTPCGYHSTAVVKGGNIYMLFPDNEWAVM